MITNIESTSLTTRAAATVQVTMMGSPGPQGPQGVPGGIPEAPLTGGPYGREAGAWAAVMSTLLYDPAGVKANCFNLANLSGNLDGGVFT